MVGMGFMAGWRKVREKYIAWIYLQLNSSTLNYWREYGWGQHGKAEGGRHRRKRNGIIIIIISMDMPGDNMEKKRGRMPAVKVIKIIIFHI